ncbi:MAG: hypothetical protein WB816_16460 [Methylocystis sp.]
MTDASYSTPPRPELALRVGVTGARALTPEAIAAFRPLVADILDFIKQEILRLAADPRASVYAPGAPALRMVSPLAEGADRLVAEEALKAGFTLFAPLPFPKAEYEKDFPLSVGTFRALLARAETLELDGSHGDLAEESYREIGRFVIRNCDVLIALWDGEPQHGGGGTGEIVQLAAQADLPIWWIDAKGLRSPRFVQDSGDLRGGGAEGETGKARLKTRIKQIILPPEFRPPEIGGLFGWCAHWLGKLCSHEERPLVSYLAEKPLAKREISDGHASLMDLLAPTQAVGEFPRIDASMARTGKYWDGIYSALDGLAITYAGCFRSSKVWIVSSFFLALAFSALGGVLPPSFGPPFAGLELAALLLAALLLIVRIAFRWHEKWTSYRLIAELCRMQYFLSSVGQALSGAEGLRIYSEGAASKESILPRDTWVAWYFSAAQRAAPFPVGSFAVLKSSAILLMRSLCGEQSDYHTVRSARYTKASRRVRLGAEICIVLTIVFSAMKVGWTLRDKEDLMTFSGALIICLSAAYAAFIDIEADSEFSVFARQSSQMVQVLSKQGADLKALTETDWDTPLFARDLGRWMNSLALSLLGDVKGWAQLYGVKHPEGGD